MLKKEHTCCFTGHGKIHANDESNIRASTLTHIQTLISKDVDTFIVGGALGYDTLVAKSLFEIRTDTHPHVQVILAYPFNGFTDDWTTEKTYDFKSMLPLKAAYFMENPMK